MGLPFATCACTDSFRDYVWHYGYEARPIDQRLDEREREELQGIRHQVAEARRRLEQMIVDYRALKTLRRRWVGRNDRRNKQNVGNLAN